MDKSTQIVHFVQNNIFFQTILVSVALIINIIPQLNNLAYASTKVFHVVLIYLSMQWLRELTNMIISEKNHENSNGRDIKPLQDSLRKSCYVLIFFTIQCGIIDLLSFGGIVIYYGCIATQELIDKGVVFLILVFLIHIAQIMVDISLTVNLFRSIPIINGCIKFT